MKSLGIVVVSVVSLLFVHSQAFGQAALERLEKRLQKPGKPARPPANADQPRPRPAPDDEKPAPRELAFEPGYLGMIADDQFDPDKGVRIVEAIADGPAANAGLREDDLIVAVNGRPVRKMDDLGRVLERSPAGAELTFDIERQGEKFRVDVTLGERPAPENRRQPEFGPVPAGESVVDPGPANRPAPARPAPAGAESKLETRLRRLEDRIEKLEQQLERIEKLLDRV